MHGLVVQWHSPAGIVTRLKRRMILRHLQQGDGHLAGQRIGGLTDLGKGPFRIETGTVQEREVIAGLPVEDA